MTHRIRLFMTQADDVSAKQEMANRSQLSHNMERFWRGPLTVAIRAGTLFVHENEPAGAPLLTQSPPNLRIVPQDGGGE